MTGGRIANPSHKPVFRPTEREFRRQHKLICAALQAPLALWRKSTRKPSANQRANHFPKDVRCVRNDAQTILAAAQIILASGANHFARCANHFASTRKSFCLEASVIFWIVARPQNDLRRRGGRKPNHRLRSPGRGVQTPFPDSLMFLVLASRIKGTGVLSVSPGDTRYGRRWSRASGVQSSTPALLSLNVSVRGQTTSRAPPRRGSPVAPLPRPVTVIDLSTGVNKHEAVLLPSFDAA